ncbi:unnamed protein product, partial [Symbiodinium necroappetens]
PVWDTLHKEEPDELANLLIRPNLCLHGGHLVAEEPQILKDTTWHGVRELSGLLAISQAAHSQLKDFLAPGTTWAKNAFGEVGSRHPCRAWQSGPESLIPNALHFDPGIKKREELVEEVLLSQRAYELQDTAAHDLVASRLHLHFDTLADLCHGLACAERSLDIVWLRNRFREPDCFGYPCVQLGVRQRVQDPRHMSRECMWDHISKISFHHNSLFEAKAGEEALELREELHAALAACGIRSHLSTAKAAVAHVLDCTERRMRGSCDAELERVMAFLERYSKQLGEEEKGPAKALLDEVLASSMETVESLVPPRSTGDSDHEDWEKVSDDVAVARATLVHNLSAHEDEEANAALASFTALDVDDTSLDERLREMNAAMARLLTKGDEKVVIQDTTAAAMDTDPVDTTAAPGDFVPEGMSVIMPWVLDIPLPLVRSLPFPLAPWRKRCSTSRASLRISRALARRVLIWPSSSPRKRLRPCLPSCRREFWTRSAVERVLEVYQIYKRQIAQEKMLAAPFSKARAGVGHGSLGQLDPGSTTTMLMCPSCFSDWQRPDNKVQGKCKLCQKNVIAVDKGPPSAEIKLGLAS